MVKLDLDGVRTILCVGAHADDIEIGCGATLLHLLARKHPIEVHWVVLGARDARAAEAKIAAELFLSGADRHEVEIKGFRDSYFPFDGKAIKEYFHDLAGRVRPDLIFTHRREDLHQDHRLVAELTWCAFRDHLILEYEIPKYDGDLGQPNVFVTLDRATCDRKVQQILTTFRSQQGKPWFTDDTLWSLLRIRGVECNAPSRFAEGFHCRKLRL